MAEIVEAVQGGPSTALGVVRYLTMTQYASP